MRVTIPGAGILTISKRINGGVTLILVGEDGNRRSLSSLSRATRRHAADVLVSAAAALLEPGSE